MMQFSNYKFLYEEGLDRKIEFGCKGQFVDRKFNAIVFNHGPITDRTLNSD
ncbi:hypothetical protein L950_0209250 [Sphingobacterium sp. IITKGP-BTPF85]|nr:hypothetical protein L950_0209250 [Sphingobacterium sp. IITKGP-BTPF85]